MLERFYNPVSGEITVDGMPIESLDLREFRRIVGYVG
jgi:ABC-type multidrug transport system fused ATPase/permease subunit